MSSRKYTDLIPCMPERLAVRMCEFPGGSSIVSGWLRSREYRLFTSIDTGEPVAAIYNRQLRFHYAVPARWYLFVPGVGESKHPSLRSAVWAAALALRRKEQRTGCRLKRTQPAPRP